MQAKKVMKIGVVGFSRNQFDKKTAKTILESIFQKIAHKHNEKVIEIVSGYTNMGIPKIAYEIANQMNMLTVGFSAQQALKVKSGVYPVDKVILEGEKFGDESHAFVQYIDGLIRIGGGKQSRHEVELFKQLNADKPIGSILTEHEVDWYGK